MIPILVFCLFLLLAGACRFTPRAGPQTPTLPRLPGGESTQSLTLAGRERSFLRDILATLDWSKPVPIAGADRFCLGAGFGENLENGEWLCGPAAHRTSGEIQHTTWAGCAQATAVELDTILGGGRPGSDQPTQTISASQLIWDFSPPIPNLNFQKG